MAIPTGSHPATEQGRTIYESAESFASQKYDYIVVGGGTAGLVIAARLTVIEAGKNKLGDSQVDIPGLLLTMLNDPEYDWCYKTTPQVFILRNASHTHMWIDLM